MPRTIAAAVRQKSPNEEFYLAGRSNPVNIMELLEILPRESERYIDSLPFSRHDTTAGSETELQAVVAGRKEDVDLPITIEQSNYFANILKRAAAGETPRRLITDLEKFLNDNPGNVWENSWARFPRRKLSLFAGRVFDRDLLADKGNPHSGQRGDVSRFIFQNREGEEHLRLPVSYLIKLALADLIGSDEHHPAVVRETGERLMGHYLNDNTSPETFSSMLFHSDPNQAWGKQLPMRPQCASC